MNLNMGMELKQEQRLIMTTELRLAISLLQFNNIDLLDYLRNETTENPMLEMKEPEIEGIASERFDDDIDWKLYAEKYGDNSYTDIVRIQEQEEYNLEAFIPYEKTLYDHLIEQWGTYKVPGEMKKIGAIIIRHLDENGYLPDSIEIIAKEANAGLDRVLDALYIVQTLEPTGVGARDLRECLLLQAEESPLYSDELYILIRDHLDEIGKNKLKILADELNCSVEFVQELIDIIKTFQPKPGASFGKSARDIKYIIPDAQIEERDDILTVTVNDVSSPRLTINPYYRKMLEKRTDIKAAEFLEERYQKALWIIKAVEQRKNTIERVIKAILERQEDFFKIGTKHLKPMTLKEVARDLNLHESTISRATSGKYVQTPKGVFELKYFFSSSLGTSAGINTSSTAVKDMIKDIIDSEDRMRPLSDMDITDCLKRKGIKISRRTVAKYRDELNILSAPKRRRFGA